MNSPLITIVVPSYNHSVYIEECLESLLVQEYKNIELIIIDDASTDDTWDKIQTYKSKLEAVMLNSVFIKKVKNGGLVDSLNMALSQAKGEFFFAVASDDSIEPFTISQLAQHLMANPDVGLVVGDMNLMNDASERVGMDEKLNVVPYEEAKNKTHCSYMRSRVAFTYEGPEFGSYETLLVRNYVPVGFMYRTQLFRELGGYNKNIKLDDYYTVLQFAKASKIEFIDKPLFNYRMHAHNTVKKRQLIWGMVMQLMKHEEAYCSKTPQLHKIWQSRMRQIEAELSLGKNPKLRRLMYKWRNSLMKRLRRDS